MASKTLSKLIPFTAFRCKLQSSTVPRQFLLCKTGIRGFQTTTGLFSERKYSDKHEWVNVNGKIGTVGISSYAQEALGEIVYAQLPDIGTQLTQMGECGALESVKAASDLYSPVSGKVTEVNKAVQDDASLINKSPLDKGWLFKLELTNAETELKNLMDEKSYEKFLKTLEH